jgi:hypothetical protein
LREHSTEAKIVVPSKKWYFNLLPVYHFTMTKARFTSAAVEYSHLWVAAGDCLQEDKGLQNPKDAQIAYINWYNISI